MFGNGMGVDLQGQGYAVTGNVFHDNQKPNVARIDDKGGAIIANNVGWDPSRGPCITTWRKLILPAYTRLRHSFNITLDSVHVSI